ncbi:MAG: hypothetical protein ACOCP8_10485, partial [archaeon]
MIKKYICFCFVLLMLFSSINVLAKDFNNLEGSFMDTAIDTGSYSNDIIDEGDYGFYETYNSDGTTELTFVNRERDGNNIFEEQS